MPDLLTDLNDAQRRVVLHERGPLLVLAGPGSGKTRVIVRHLAHRVVVRGCNPERLLAITFTNRAGHEMKHRMRELLEEGAGVPPIGTFHWMCAAFLRRHTEAL